MVLIIYFITVVVYAILLYPFISDIAVDYNLTAINKVDNSIVWAACFVIAFVPIVRFLCLLGTVARRDG